MIPESDWIWMSVPDRSAHVFVRGSLVSICGLVSMHEPDKDWSVLSRPHQRGRRCGLCKLRKTRKPKFLTPKSKPLAPKDLYLLLTCSEGWNPNHEADFCRALDWIMGQVSLRHTHGHRMVKAFSLIRIQGLGMSETGRLMKSSHHGRTSHQRIRQMVAKCEQIIRLPFNRELLVAVVEQPESVTHVRYQYRLSGENPLGPCSICGNEMTGRSYFACSMSCIGIFAKMSIRSQFSFEIEL